MKKSIRPLPASYKIQISRINLVSLLDYNTALS